MIMRLVVAALCIAAAGCVSSRPVSMPAPAAATAAAEQEGAGTPEYRVVKRTLSLVQSRDYQGVTDAELDGELPMQNRYYDDIIGVYGGEVGSQSLLRFDDITVPTDAEITRAFIVLYMTRKSKRATGVLYAYRMIVDCDYEQATWDHYDKSGGIRWGNDSQPTPKAGVDYSPEEICALDSTDIFPDDTVRLDVTDAARFWTANPDKNYGILLKCEPDKNVGAFASSETVLVSERPHLYVTYTQKIRMGDR